MCDARGLLLLPLTVALAVPTHAQRLDIDLHDLPRNEVSLSSRCGSNQGAPAMSRHTKIALLLTAGAVTGATAATGQSGTFTFVTGDVSVERRDGQRVPVTRGTAVHEGDSIVTGERAMAQLTMVDQARLSLRPNTQFQIEQYADRPDADQGALLNLVRGTLRTFTGLIAARSRERFLMKTKVATVGIRGSGNVLFAGKAVDCDPDRIEGPGGACDITVNHTIDGSHSVTFGELAPTGLPPQQGGAQTLVTGPGQTVLVTARGDVRYIPTPHFIAESAMYPAGAAPSKGGAGEGGEETRDFGPADSSGSTTQQGTATQTPVGNNGLGFTIVDPASLVDPQQLQDIVIAADSTLTGQALPAGVTRESGHLRAYQMYPGLYVGLEPTIGGGTPAELGGFSSGGLRFSVGRWQDASFGYFGQGTGVPIPGSVHWVVAGSGYPSYLTDVLTGTVRYTPVIHTSPTNQVNTAGTLTGAQIDVNFGNRTLNTSIGVSVPGSAGNAGGSWQLSASDVPFGFGTFYASTGDRLHVGNGSSDSQSDHRLFGTLEGSFVGSGLQGIALGYSLRDETASNPANHNSVNGVIGFQGPVQDMTAPYRDGLVSDPSGVLGSSLVRNLATANRPEEVTVDAQGAASGFAAPFRTYGGHQAYERGTASVAQSGLDPQTGLVWGRWAGGVATVTGGGVQQTLPLNHGSLHYVFSAPQNAPVALPLSGAATYELVGSTSPTDGMGNVGTLNSASLAADFSNRTVNLGVNLTIAGQQIGAAANRVPIYRDQYFSAFRGDVPTGLPIPQLLNISCQPSCPGAAGSVDGFFAGRTGQGAGMMYNLNGASGAAAFRRPGG